MPRANRWAHTLWEMSTWLHGHLGNP